MQLRILLFLSTMMICLCTTASQPLAYVNDSAHGSTTYGVERPDLSTAGFAVANCAHCHEQHASVGGSEPAPANGAKEYLLFDQSNTDQATNFCFNCHGTGIAYQTSGHVTNRSYSYRAGGWLLDPLSSDIKSAFAQASSHNLGDIVSFAAGNPPNWKYTTKSNACAVCHDPHVVQGDPPDPTNFKSLLTRGVAISEINSLSSPVNLWGDIAAEMMRNYTLNYQAPYRVAGTNFEPAGDGTFDGSNLPDYVTFCSKCHDKTVTNKDVTSTDLGRVVKNIDWTAGPNGDKHGQFFAEDDIQMQPSPALSPYTSGGGALGYVLSCLDCHEPHGSGNLSLLRGKVNGQVLVPPYIATGIQFDLICRQCHNPNTGAAADWEWEHHGNTDAPYQQFGPCTDCHGLPGTQRIDCATCHYHGAVAGSGGIPQANRGALSTVTPKTF